MKKVLKRTLSVFLAVTMLFGTATLSGIADIDLSEVAKMFPEAKAFSDDCITKEYVNYEIDQILYSGQDYYFRGTVSYVFCDNSGYIPNEYTMEYEIKDDNGCVFNDSSPLSYVESDNLTWIYSYTIHIPANSLGTGEYSLSLEFPGVCCPTHYRFTFPSLYVGRYFKIVDTYTLTYDTNGGSGAPSAQTGNTEYTVSSTIPVRFGYNFRGWSTNPGSTYADYTLGSKITLSENTTLYAVWSSAPNVAVNDYHRVNIDDIEWQDYYVRFTPSASKKYRFESTGSLDSRIYLMDSTGNQLAYDDDSGSGSNFCLEYALTAGAIYYVKIQAYSADTGYTNLWINDAEYTLSYDADGGNGAPKTQTGAKAYYVSSVIPVKEGFVFKGWKRISGSFETVGTPAEPPYGGWISYYAGDYLRLASDVTLKAVWEEDPNYVNPDEPAATLNMCSKCGRVFADESMFNLHKTICIDSSDKSAITYICSYCGQIFTNRTAFSAHLVGCSKKPTSPTVDSSNENICYNCGRSFRSEAEYNNHIQVCTDVFACDYCKSEFRSQSACNEHKKTCSSAPTEPATKPSTPATKPATTKPAVTKPSTTKPSTPTTKPTESTTKPAQPTTKPSVPTTKPTEPATKPSFSKTCPYCSLSFSNEAEYNKHVAYENEKKNAKVDIRKPSQTEIKYGDSIIIHADVENLPEGAKIVWTADNANFTYTASADGTTCTITPTANGTTTFTVTIVDKDGNEICSDTQTMTSKAGFFQKIIAFFKKIFGLTKIIPEMIK